jgi:hypothetical protein
MKLPRWLLVSLIGLSAVALLVMPTWLWVETPRWTAQKFVAAIESHNVGTANELLTDAACGFREIRELREAAPPTKYVRLEDFQNRSEVNFVGVRIVPIRRDFRDLTLGRQRMVVETYEGKGLGLEFCVYRDHVTTNFDEFIGTMFKL